MRSERGMTRQMHVHIALDFDRRPQESTEYEFITMKRYTYTYRIDAHSVNTNALDFCYE